ncbi:hypothetical protein L6164_034967 [Bauhinia variegata]|uniref:Uncharacterized protein n=1 Tax=Bauhinia variegata TaxID=167791 RepID=A0ACB9KXD5_BAUVA|nr:hypothetical protein L6164_034967 [Bauhinia variegata]
MHYIGTCKATAKFRALEHHVHLVLHNDPKPGPATFVIHCLYLLPLFGEHNEGLSHLVSSALQRFLKRQITSEDSQEVKDLAARLFLDIVGGQSNQFKAAEKWATFMGKPMLCILVQEYIERNMLKAAYEIIKKNNLRQDFPDVYQKCKESSLKKLAEKGCWDVAEAKTNSDKHLIEYLVYLAMEADYTEKVDELCDRYSLDRFLDIKVPETSIQPGRHLCLDEFSVEDIIWVDEVEGLLGATCYIEECKVIGVDCEWKPNYKKGSKPNKVSIMQIASEKAVFIFDLIKLHGEVPDILDNCLTRILQSPKILKLGYNFQSDTKQLSHSYEELKCFKYCEMFLDIQNFSKEPRGGLSGLAEKILGAGLNKTRRNSNWEQRPLTENQLEYAALDAVVLIRIFCHIRGQCQPSEAEKHEKLEWKSYIVAHMDNIKKPKKNTKNLKRA